MKPIILKWTYLALGFLILTNTLNILLHPAFIFSYSSFFDPILPTIIIRSDNTNGIDIKTNAVNFVNYPILHFIVVVASVATTIGLIKVAPWSRTAAYLLIGFSAISGIVMSMTFVVTGEDRIADLLRTFIIFDILLLALAYKLYFSKPLKEYLANNSKVRT
ncbi:MAG: hypothetical protein AMJ53_07165 [Gammaproteobacteria bacterium SG8_11]|nr:MAG: hypothetical protein AMJ53_07165 [Gammaproteobacteria bacterium SG8_11]